MNISRIPLRRFIARLPNGKRKAEEYAASGLFAEAAEAAAAARDGELLGRIQVRWLHTSRFRASKRFVSRFKIKNFP